LRGPLNCTPCHPQYFFAHNSLARSYWHGIRRDNSSYPWAYLNGSSVPQLPSSSPFAHWDYNHGPLAAKAGYHCAAAFADTAFDAYVGNTTGANATQQLRDPRYFTSNAPVLLGGWSAYGCSAPMRYVCMILASTFPIPEPPLPPGDPPLPPSPPSPPMPENCAPLPGPNFFCEFENITCFSYLQELLTQQQARQRCATFGGDLWLPESAQQQVCQAVCHACQ
jgi:hypothetical protein